MAHAKKKHSKWPLYLVGASAAVAVWSGWVGLGGLSGFGLIHPLPGIWDSFHLNTAITLPIGVEAYGAYALGTWIDPATPKSARKFAKRSSIGSLLLGMLGQIAYHLLAAAHRSAAPWEIVTVVACLPVVTLGLAAGLHHLKGLEEEEEEEPTPAPGDLSERIERLEPKPAPVPMPVQPQPEIPPAPMPRPAANIAKPAPWEDPSWVQPTPPQPALIPDDGYSGHVTVRSPLSRAERKVPVDERVAARMTGSFPAVQE